MLGKVFLLRHSRVRSSQLVYVATGAMSIVINPYQSFSMGNVRGVSFAKADREVHSINM